MTYLTSHFLHSVIGEKHSFLPHIVIKFNQTCHVKYNSGQMGNAEKMDNTILSL